MTRQERQDAIERAQRTRKALTTTVFPQLRKLGVLARVNFMCCGGCALEALREPLEKDEKRIGVVFWHSQDDERLRNGGHLFLNYSAREITPSPLISPLQARNEQDRATTRLGWLIVGLCRAAGLAVEWNGDHMERIRLTHGEPATDARLVELEAALAAAKREAEDYRAANESVRVCAQHTADITEPGPCLVCALEREQEARCQTCGDCNRIYPEREVDWSRCTCPGDPSKPGAPITLDPLCTEHAR